MHTIDTYQEHIGSKYQLALDDDSLELELIEVNKVSADTTEAGQAVPFSAVFRSTDKEEALEQGTYSLTHDGMGELLIFIVPIGPDDTGMRYEAVFT